MNKPSKISVLVSLYQKNNIKEVERCFNSLAIQTYIPDEVILVIDGPIDFDIERILKAYLDILYIKVYHLKSNVGLGKVLNIGLQHCSYDFIARIDIDDVCKPNRLEIQKTFLDSNSRISIMGGQIDLFDDCGVYAKRAVPISHKSIEQTSLFRNPVNHSTVMFRKNEVNSLGGYPETRFTQDYILWINCLHSGLSFYNHPDVLCDMFADKNILSRRGLGNLKYDLMPYFLNYRLRRNSILVLILMISVRSLFNSVNSLRSFLKNW